MTDSTQQCRLLGGIFSSFIQATLGMLCVATLWYKRLNEVPQRDWYVWLLDVLKQGIGSSFGHFSNIFLSVVIAKTLPNGDECQWYCLTYIVDSTMGTFLNLSFLSIFENILQRRLKCCPQLIFGEYGDPPLLSKWIPQLVIWLIIVVIGKSIILFFMLNLIARIDTAIKYAFQIFSHQPEVELVMVMIVIPTILNTIQFWVTDNFLKGQNDAEQLDEDSTQSLDEELISKNTFGDVEVSNTTPAKSKKRYTSRSSHNHIYMEMSSTMNAKHKDSSSSSSTSRSNSSDHSNSNSNSSEKSKYFKLSSSPPSSGPSAVASAAKLLTQTSSTIYKSYAPPTSAIHRAYERSGVPYLVNTVVELFVPATSGEAATAQKRNHQSSSRKSSNSNVSGDYSGLGGQEGDGDEKDDDKDVDPLGQFEFDDPYITDHLLFKSSDAAPSRGRRVTSTSSSNDEIDLNTSKSSFL